MLGYLLAMLAVTLGGCAGDPARSPAPSAASPFETSEPTPRSDPPSRTQHPSPSPTKDPHADPWFEVRLALNRPGELGLSLAEFVERFNAAVVADQGRLEGEFSLDADELRLEPVADYFHARQGLIRTSGIDIYVDADRQTVRAAGLGSTLAPTSPEFVGLAEALIAATGPHLTAEEVASVLPTLTAQEQTPLFAHIEWGPHEYTLGDAGENLYWLVVSQGDGRGVVAGLSSPQPRPATPSPTPSPTPAIADRQDVVRIVETTLEFYIEGVQKVEVSPALLFVEYGDGNWVRDILQQNQYRAIRALAFGLPPGVQPTIVLRSNSALGGGYLESTTTPDQLARIRDFAMSETDWHSEAVFQVVGTLY